MGKLLGLKYGTITLITDKGKLQIYIKNKNAIVTLESDKQMVKYAKCIELNTIISPFTLLVSRCLPNKWALKAIGSEFGKRDIIPLEDDNEKLILKNERIKSGNGITNFSFHERSKPLNLFEEYEKNPNIFNGFCNFKIDSKGNIIDKEREIERNMFTPKYSLKVLEQNEKYKENLQKESATEKYLSKIYHEYLEKNKDTMGDVQKATLKKIKNMFQEVNEALEEEKKSDFIEKLARAESAIVSRTESIPKLSTYINDSRINDVYSNEDIAKTLGNIYVKEKLDIFHKDEHIKEKFDNNEVDKKLTLILEEDIVSEYKKEERANYENMLPIKFIEARMELLNLDENEREKIRSDLKNYVNLLECMDYSMSDNPKAKKDKKEIESIYELKSMSDDTENLGVVLKNYENYIEEGLMPKLVLDASGGFATGFRNILKTGIIKQKTNCKEVVIFSHQEENENDIEGDILEEVDTQTKVEYNYLINDEKTKIYKDNILETDSYETQRIMEEHKKYGGDSGKKTSLKVLENKIYIPSKNIIVPIKYEYTDNQIKNYTMYMLKTWITGKDLKIISYTNMDLEDEKLNEDKKHLLQKALNGDFFNTSKIQDEDKDLIDEMPHEETLTLEEREELERENKEARGDPEDFYVMKTDQELELDIAALEEVEKQLQKEIDMSKQNDNNDESIGL